MKKLKSTITSPYGLKRLLMAGALGVLFNVSQNAIAAGPVGLEMSGWNLHGEGYPNTVAMQKFADLIADGSDGRIKLKMSNNAELGSQPEAIDMLIENKLEVANLSLGPLGQIAPATNVVSLPFIFKDMGHMHRAMDGEAGDIISAELEERGIVALAWYDSGARSFYNKKWPINSPDDIEGLTIRVMGNDLYSGMISAMGGTPQKLAFPKVLGALQSGDIDGAENNWPSYEGTGHYEVAGYYSLSQHLIIPECVCVNASVYNALSAEDQALMKAAARESAELQRELWVERAEASREQVLASGVKFNEVSNKRAFQAAMRPVYSRYLAVNRDLAPLVDLIREID